MTITPALLVAIGEALMLQPAVGALRQRFRGIHFTECGEDDISPRHTPVFAGERHDLYLVAGASGACLALTDDFAAATGVVVAARADEE